MHLSLLILVLILLMPLSLLIVVLIQFKPLSLINKYKSLSIWDTKVYKLALAKFYPLAIVEHKLDQVISINSLKVYKSQLWRVPEYIDTYLSFLRVLRIDFNRLKIHLEWVSLAYLNAYWYISYSYLWYSNGSSCRKWLCHTGIV